MRLDVREQPVRAAVEVVSRNNLDTGLQEAGDDVERSHAARHGKGMLGGGDFGDVMLCGLDVRNCTMSSLRAEWRALELPLQRAPRVMYLKCRKHAASIPAGHASRSAGAQDIARPPEKPNALPRRRRFFAL